MESVIAEAKAMHSTRKWERLNTLERRVECMYLEKRAREIVNEPHKYSMEEIQQLIKDTHTSDFFSEQKETDFGR
eukprot:826983-Karenia_brevis.AAC.1